MTQATIDLSSLIYPRVGNALGANDTKINANFDELYASIGQVQGLVSILSFDADPTGVADSTAAFEAAITAVARPVGKYHAFDGSSASIISTGSETITIAGHAFLNGDLVRYKCGIAGTAIAGLTDGGKYFIVGATSTTVQLSATLGGSAINLTAVGTGTAHTLTKGGGTLHLAPGVYTVTGLTLHDDTILEGAGKGVTVIRLADSSDEHVIGTDGFDTLANDSARASPVGCCSSGLRNLTVDGNYTNQSVAHHGLAYYGIDLTWEDIEVKNCLGWGVYTESPGSAFSTTVGQNLQTQGYNLEAHDNQAGNLRYNGQSDSSLIGLKLYQTADAVGSRNLYIGNKGQGSRFTSLHTWGSCEYQIENQGFRAELVAPHIEGPIYLGDILHVTGGLAYNTAGAATDPLIAFADSVGACSLDFNLGATDFKYLVKCETTSGTYNTVKARHFSSEGGNTLYDPSGVAPDSTWYIDYIHQSGSDGILRINRAFQFGVNGVSITRTTASDSLTISADPGNTLSGTAINLATDGTTRCVLTSNNFRPGSNDNCTLGTAAISWSDLFLADGGVINWNNGNFTATHSAGALAFSGAISATQITTSSTDFMHETSANLADGAAAQVATLTNSPVVGNPTKWIAVNDNGTTRYIPTWSA